MNALARVGLESFLSPSHRCIKFGVNHMLFTDRFIILFLSIILFYSNLKFKCLHPVRFTGKFSINIVFHNFQYLVV